MLLHIALVAIETALITKYTYQSKFNLSTKNKIICGDEVVLALIDVLICCLVCYIVHETKLYGNTESDK